MPTSLYRPEVLEARRDAWIGEAQIAHPLPVRLTATVCALFVAATALLAIFGTYTRRVHAEGLLAPDVGLLTLASPSAGRIGAAGVTEGDKVEKGQLLFSIDVDAISASGPTQRRVIAELRNQTASVVRQRSVRISVAALEKRGLEEQLANTQDQSRALGAQIELQRKLSQALKDHADQLQRTFAAGMARAADVQNQNYLYIQTSAQLAQFEQSALQLTGKADDLQSQLAQFDDKLARDVAELDRQIAQLDQQVAESEARQAIEIRAPETGVLTSIRVHVGQQVAAGGPLLTLLPNAGRLQANLFVDSSAIGLVADGEHVMLRYAAFPFQRYGLYGGHVAEVTRAPVEAAETPQGTARPGSDGLYRIIVRPDRDTVTAYGAERRLEAGMRVEADIALERRPLYRWLLDPVSHLARSADLVVHGGLK